MLTVSVLSIGDGKHREKAGMSLSLEKFEDILFQVERSLLDEHLIPFEPVT